MNGKDAILLFRFIVITVSVLSYIVSIKPGKRPEIKQADTTQHTINNLIKNGKTN